MNKVSSQILNAVMVTILACGVVFGLATYFFDLHAIWQPTLPPPIPGIPETSGSVTIPVVLDDTGSVSCTMDYTPVCGSDGQTYSNSCLANSKGITSMTEGECIQDIVATGALESTGTVETDHTGSLSDVPPTSPEDDAKVCTKEYAPICGVDGKTYGNSCMAGEVAIAHIGECDGTEKKVYDTGSYQLYANKNIGYGFAMPKYSYYASAGANDGANHTMAIATTASGVTEFATAPVQVWFYRKAPATPPSDQSAKVENGILYIKNNDTTGNAKITKIVEVILESVK